MFDILVIVLSTLGFAGFLALDAPLLRQGPIGRNIVSIVAVGLLTAALILTTRQGVPLGITADRRWIGIICIIIGGVLTTYSTLLEIPLAMRRFPQKHANGLYRQGTYALCRHPGFLWLIVDLTGLVIVINLVSTLELCLFWITIDFLIILVQDRIIFPRLLPAYADYQRTTPFVIPNLSSIQVILKSVKEFTF